MGESIFLALMADSLFKQRREDKTAEEEEEKK